MPVGDSIRESKTGANAANLKPENFMKTLTTVLILGSSILHAQSPDAVSSAEIKKSPTPVRIMPVGDSITEGGGSFRVYRPLLAEKLKQAGFSVEFVGSKKDKANMAHEGYGGKSAQQIAKIVPANFRQHPADIVLLHAGHNNFADKKPVPAIIAATESMIVEFRKTNPKVIVLLAQVIPSGLLPKYGYIPELNQELAKLAERLNSPDQPVLLVDHFTGFDPETDTVDDEVHPNASGGEKMAERWFQTLQPLLSSNAPAK